MIDTQTTKWITSILLTVSICLLVTSLPGYSHTQAAPATPDVQGTDTAPAQVASCAALTSTPERFAFAVTADMRMFSGPTYDTTQYFRGATEAIVNAGSSAFMVSPGDIDPTTDVMWTITHTMGITYTWYPVVGNHELPVLGEQPYIGANMDWLRAYDYGTVNPGPSGCPETTYSFDHKNAHFVMLNEYCDTAGDTETDGDIPDHLYNWLVNDLDSTDKPHVFVFGHEPAYPQPDADNGRLRHVGDSLDQPDHEANRDRFWSLLESKGVTAYICGHTHNYSGVKIDNVWQLDAGHARGLGDTGARSTFIIVCVDDTAVTFEAHRDDAGGGDYTLMHIGVLTGTYHHLPLVMRSP
jgi:hypothetical protein